MKIEEILSRRLDPVACKIVGTKIKAQVLALQGKENFPQKLSDSVTNFIKDLDALINFFQDSVTIKIVDRGADTSFGGFRSLLEGIAETLHSVDFLTIHPDAQTRAENARKLLAIAYPKKTAFLKARHEDQWAEMDRIVRDLKKEESQKLISALQLELEVKRLEQWLVLYGEKKNITTEEEDLATKAQDLLDRWHKSYARLLTQALALYDDDENKEHLEKRRAFVDAYQEQLEQMRQEDQAYREELKKKKEAAQTTK